MPPRGAVLPLFLLPALVCAAEPPAIRRQGVVNAASRRPAEVGGAIARGSLISIQGIGFAAGIGSNRVTLVSGSRGRWLTVVYADPQRLDAWMPADVPLGPARLTVTSGGLQSEPEEITILKSAPGLFSANGEGWGPARSANHSGNSVAPGGRLTLEATGVAPGDKPEVRLGNVRAPVVSIRVPVPPDYRAGLTIEVPSDAAEGCYVPVYVRVPGAPPSNAVTIAVHRGGGACVRPPDDPAAGWTGGKTAILLLSRLVRRTPDAPEDRTEDEITAGFFDIPKGPALFSPVLLLPPPGVCTAWSGALKGDTPLGSSVWSLLFGSVPGSGLDAGRSIAVRNAGMQVRAPFVAGAPGLYRRLLAEGPGRASSRPRLSLDSGRLGIAGSGGSQVGAFAVALPVPAGFAVPRPPAGTVARSRPFAVEWIAGEGGGSMAIVLAASDPNRNVAGLAYCNAPKSAGRLVIPADLLAQLPGGTGDLLMVSWWGQAIEAPPAGIQRMEGLSVFARSFEVRIE